jgi:hypothetical protein
MLYEGTYGGARPPADIRAVRRFLGRRRGGKLPRLAGVTGEGATSSAVCDGSARGLSSISSALEIVDGTWAAAPNSTSRMWSARNSYFFLSLSVILSCNVQKRRTRSALTGASNLCIVTCINTQSPTVKGNSLACFGVVTAKALSDDRAVWTWVKLVCTSMTPPEDGKCSACVQGYTTGSCDNVRAIHQTRFRTHATMLDVRNVIGCDWGIQTVHLVFEQCFEGVIGLRSHTNGEVFVVSNAFLQRLMQR